MDFFMCLGIGCVCDRESNSRDRSRKQITKFFSFFGYGRGGKEKNHLDRRSRCSNAGPELCSYENFSA